MNFTIELNNQDELSYRGYWIDTREALIEVGELIGGIK